MPNVTRAFWRLVLLGVLFGSTAGQAAQPHLFVEGKYRKGELKYINGLPVLIVQGTPEELGRQQAALTSAVARHLLSYPKDLLSVIGREERWPEYVERGRLLLPHFPKGYLHELEAFASASGLDRDLLVGLNTILDTYRGGLGCSSLIIQPERSTTEGPLFGRNLDFFTLGKLQRYCLIVVCRPEGKHAFASVGFPGLFGCLSGMNDAGLALAAHEVFFSRDGSPKFDPAGVPYTLCCRRVLEECTTVDEAEKLVRLIKRTTWINLALCDRRQGAILEITPETVVRRGPTDGVCACTNHFRSKPLATFTLAWRYRLLMASKNLSSLGLNEVARKLHEVNLGRLTMQTMIFQPAPLELHLAFGSCPSSALPLKHLELGPLFQAGSDRRKLPGGPLTATADDRKPR